MSIKNILDNLENIIPKENFKSQPETAKLEILSLENEYNINTYDFLIKNHDKEISDDDIDRWLRTYETFLNFNGKTNDINHITHSDFEDFIQNKKIYKDYATADKEESLNEGFFFYYFIYPHSFFRMK